MSELALIKEQTLTNIGDAIREKTNTTDKIYPKDMPEKIRNIQTGGINLKDLLTKTYKIVVDQANMHNQYIEYNITMPYGTDTTKHKSINDATKTYDTNSLIYLAGEIKPMEGYKPGKLKAHSDIGLFDDAVIDKDVLLSVPFISDVYITEVEAAVESNEVNFENYMNNWYTDTCSSLTELSERTKAILTNSNIKAVGENEYSDPTLNRLFAGCTSLKRIPKITVNTADVESMTSMFDFCSALEKVDLSGLNTAKVKQMNMLFYACDALKSIDLSSLNTSSIERFDSIIRNCNQLEVVDMSGSFIINPTKITSYDHIINQCSSLKYIILNDENTQLLTNSTFVEQFNDLNSDISTPVTFLIPGDQAKLDSIMSQIDTAAYASYNVHIELISGYTITKPGDGTVEVKKKINKKGTITFVTHANPATITIDVDQNGSLVEPLTPKIDNIKPGYFVEYWGDKPVDDGSGLTTIRTIDFGKKMKPQANGKKLSKMTILNISTFQKTILNLLIKLLNLECLDLVNGGPCL